MDCCHDCKSSKYYHEHSTKQEWPPQLDQCNESTQYDYTPLVVGTDLFPTIGHVLSAIKVTQYQKEGRKLYNKYGCTSLSENLRSNYGYAIHLPCGQHTISEEHISDLKHLRFIGDVSEVKGVAYFHKVGQWQDYDKLHGEFDTCEGGEAEFELSYGCDSITVSGCSEPNFNSVRCGDKVTFYRQGQCHSTHYVRKACHNTLYFQDQLGILDKCGQKGDGFFIHPNVSLKFCGTSTDHQKILVEHRLEFLGINFKLNNAVTLGTTGGHHEISHSVIEGKCGYLVMEGKADWSRPNVFTTQLHFNSASRGTVYLQSFVGCEAGLTTYSVAKTKFHYSIFVGNKLSVDSYNHSELDLFSSHFYLNDVAIKARHSSEISIPKTIIENSVTALYILHKSHVSGFGIYNPKTVQHQQVKLYNNKKAVVLNHDAHANFDAVEFNGNNTDLIIGGNTFNDITTFNPNTNNYVATNFQSLFFFQELL